MAAPAATQDGSLSTFALEHMKLVVHEHHPKHTVISSEVAHPVIRNGYTTYILTLDPPSTSFLTISTPDGPAVDAEPPSEVPGIPPHSFEVIAHLAERIRTHTSMPIPDLVLGDCDTHRYMLTAPQPIRKPVPLANAALDERQRAMVDLKLGQAFAQLHQNVQNDWFGLPAVADPAPAAALLPGFASSALAAVLTGAPSDTAYSWQETFTGLLEDILHHLPPAHVDAVPLEDIRAALCRAIGFYLFDDAEVPALVTLTGCQDMIYVQEDTTGEVEVPIVLPPALALCHAVFGDPLLEGMFMPPGPGEAFMEGYKGALIVFPRQKTKRLWYTLFFALLALTAKRRDKQDEEWALKMIRETAEALKTAPTY
ncbi:hypothetical protein BD626DRAFT_509711 [Schizophyllum amplum]|uniref:Aminoglycoside phosphotransferase domain-containing protein n=1 Tax=Schizophyllum amplum TaxID=97359 RepID=A0A550C2T0_9AGAR|nr:hypothetical protein BD626DRAFT_509711 [Auriculariopsis ampla]